MGTLRRREFIAATAASTSLTGTSASAQGPAQPDHAGLLARHDVVYLSPSSERSECLPLGNGDLVAMVSTPPRGLDLIINKSNLWDDRPNEPRLAENWAWDASEEEEWTTITGGARLSIRSALPVLDPLYLDDFEARLQLHEAKVRVSAASPLGRLQAAAWISAKPSVLVIDYDESVSEPVSREIELERLGSRRLFHWYSQYDPKKTSTGLFGTRSGSDGKRIWIEQQLRSIRFAVVARFEGAKCRTEQCSAHSAVIVTEKSTTLKGQLFLSIVTSEEASDPLAAARRAVDSAVAQGRDSNLSAHRKHWSGFWEKSYVSVPEDYLENLYYFSLYQLAASSQGAYPPTHCGGLWFWNRDIRRWGHYYHWNVQQQYWPVHASNHPELMQPYLSFRRKTLPEAEKYARDVHKRGGAFYSDVTDRLGRGTVHQHVMYIMTAGPQIAMDFWRHYQYTLDRDFLRNSAYPVMKATAQFYIETLERTADGQLHMPRSTGYENNLEQRDTISDLATIRQHFPACIRASEILGVDEALRLQWSAAVNNLAGFTVMDNAADENGRKLPRVFSSGVPLVDSKVGPDRHHRWTKVRQVRKGERQFNISFYVENATVFPSGIVGLGQRGTDLFEVAVNTALALGPGPAWNSLPAISLARLGKGDESLNILGDTIERYQKYPQGYFAELTEIHEFSGNRFDMSRPARLVNNKRGERGMLPGEWFDYPDLELGGVLMTTINEMLLQSHDGVIRVFPAMPKEWRDAAFHLRATGAFLVTAEMRGGEVHPFTVESLAGAECRIELPWPDAAVRDLASGDDIPQSPENLTVRFPSRSGGRYLVYRKNVPASAPRPPAPKQAANGPKEWRGRRIGIPRQF